MRPLGAKSGTSWFRCLYSALRFPTAHPAWNISQLTLQRVMRDVSIPSWTVLPVRGQSTISAIDPESRIGGIHHSNRFTHIHIESTVGSVLPSEDELQEDIVLNRTNTTTGRTGPIARSTLARRAVSNMASQAGPSRGHNTNNRMHNGGNTAGAGTSEQTLCRAS